jgi:phage terminase large subunit-like protein
MQAHAQVIAPPPAGDVASLPIAEPDWIARAADEHGYGWARLAWQRAAAVPGAWFDAAKADRVIAAWPGWFSLTVGRFAGKPFRLAFWQEVIVRLLIGWKAPIEAIDPDSAQPTEIHVRLFRELRLWIPRKNGKSEFLAALSLYFWAVEGLRRGEGYAFASSEDQARIAFTKMSDIVGYSRDLSADVKCYATHLWIQELKSPFVLLTGKAAGKHGLAPTVTLGDEMHEWPTRDLADTLRQGESSLEPIRLYASTAGLKTQACGYELWEESCKLDDGRIVDPRTLVVIFAAGEDAEWESEQTWRIANPSLGLSPTLATLREDAAKARESATALAAFRRYRLNQWVEDVTRWLPLKKWDACSSGKDAWKSLPDELAGRECVLTFDSTKSFDFAAMCLRFPPLAKDERARLIWRFWLPAETIAQRSKSEQVPIDRWRDAGAVTEIPGGVFVLSWALQATHAAVARYKVTRIGWDSWAAAEYYNRLVAPNPDDGAPPLPEDLFVEMRFGTRSLGAASKEFERKVFGGELDHGGNPVARWMAGHCHVRFDENMNFVPAKKRSEQSIDGIVAAVMAEALAMPGEPGKQDVLNEWLAAAPMR